MNGRLANSCWIWPRSTTSQIITIEQLIAHRRVSEKLVSRVAEADLPTKSVDFRVIAYEVKYEEQTPMAITCGDLSKVTAPLVRLHSSCFTGDLDRFAAL